MNFRSGYILTEPVEGSFSPRPFVTVKTRIHEHGPPRTHAHTHARMRKHIAVSAELHQSISFFHCVLNFRLKINREELPNTLPLMHSIHYCKLEDNKNKTVFPEERKDVICSY